MQRRLTKEQKFESRIKRLEQENQSLKRKLDRAYSLLESYQEREESYLHNIKEDE